jgi:hypothetical protein
MLPDRIRTGYKDRTIPNPAGLAGQSTWFGVFENSREVYQGPVSGYNFRKQAENFIKLKNVLEANGIKFTAVSGLLYNGDRGYNQRFVVLTSHPAILWYKYVGFIAQSGQNHIFIHGRRIKVSLFLAQLPEVQTALLHNRMDEVDMLVKDGHLKWLDESAAYWN